MSRIELKVEVPKGFAWATMRTHMWSNEPFGRLKQNLVVPTVYGQFRLRFRGKVLRDDKTPAQV